MSSSKDWAAIERGQGADDAVVRGWLTRALTAPRGPQWVCDKCQSIHRDWHPICTHCDSFDTLSWKEPPQSEASLPGGVEMLPLLVGRPKEVTEDAPVPEVVAEVEEIKPEANDDKVVEPPRPDDVEVEPEFHSAEDEARRVF